MHDEDAEDAPCHRGEVRMGRHWATDTLGVGGCYVYVVAASVGAYWFFVSLIPVYNKYFFAKEFYPFPIATAGIQLGIVAILLSLFNVVQHFISHRKHCTKDGFATLLDESPTSPDATPISWIFGPYLPWKLRWVGPIGILFGLKYGVTNLGLNLVPAPTHLLLQSTDLVWTILGAWWINGERISPVGLLCLMGCVAGSVVLSLQLGQAMASPLPAIAVNLLSPILLGLCITTLRAACVELMRHDNRVGGTVGVMELTALKLAISSAVAIVLASIFETSNVADEDASVGVSESWLEAFGSLPPSTKLGVLGGALPILAFQVNCTFLTFLTSSVAVGLVGQLKIIPQWIVAALFAPNINFKLGTLNVVGALLTMASASAFAVHNWMVCANDASNCEGSASTSESSENMVLLETCAPLDGESKDQQRSDYLSIEMERQ